MSDENRSNEIGTSNTNDTTFVSLRMTTDQADKLRALFESGELTHLGILDLVIETGIAEKTPSKKWSDGQRERHSSHKDRTKR